MQPVFSILTGDDLREIQVQPSQRSGFGLDGTVSEEMIPFYLAGPQAWACRLNGRLIACFGVAEQHAGMQGVGWALLAAGLGPAHVALTRKARAALADCDLGRVEALVRGPDIEHELAKRPWLDAGQKLAIALAVPTREMRWASALGLEPAHVLRRFGPHAETALLYERIGGPAASKERMAA